MPVIVPPAGLTPAGFFTPQTYAQQGRPPAILAYARDPQTHEFRSLARGMDPIDAQVIDALVIVRASGVAVAEDGQDFTTIRKIGDDFAAGVDSAVRRALRRLVDNGDIQIVSLVAESDPDHQAGAAWLKYTNLRAKGDQRRKIQVLP